MHTSHPQQSITLIYSAGGYDYFFQKNDALCIAHYCFKVEMQVCLKSGAFDKNYGTVLPAGRGIQN